MRILVVAMLLGLGGCRPSGADCERLLDHFLDVEGDAATAGQFREMTPPMRTALGEAKQNFRAQLHDEFVAKCTQQLSRAQVACAVAAADPAAMDRCEGR